MKHYKINLCHHVNHDQVHFWSKSSSFLKSLSKWSDSSVNSSLHEVQRFQVFWWMTWLPSYDCENSNANDAHWIFTILRVIISDWSSENDVELVCVWVKDVLIFLTCFCLEHFLLKSNHWTIAIKLLIIWFTSKLLNISKLTLYRNDVNFFSMIVDFL